MALKEILKELLGDKANEEIMGKIDNAFKNDASELVEKETKGLKQSQKSLLDDIKKLKDNQLPENFDKEKFDKYLKDAEEFEQKQRQLEEERLAKEGQWDALKEQLIAKNKDSLEKLKKEKDDEISILQKALDSELIENHAIKAIEKEKGNSFFLLPHIKQQIKTVNEDGVFSVRVFDKDGNVRMNDEGKPFTVQDLVTEMKANEQYSLAFPDLNSGTGNPAKGGTGGGGIVNPWKADTKNVTMQAKITRENPQLAMQMKKAANVAV